MPEIELQDTAVFYNRGQTITLNNVPKKCPICGSYTRYVEGRNGAFLSCNNFRTHNCRFTYDLKGPRVTTLKPQQSLFGSQSPVAAAPTQRVSMPPNPNSIVGSEEQEAIWEEIVNGNQHLVVDAKAGTGKTFTAVHSIQKLRKSSRNQGRVGFTAFNSHIAKELASKVPAGIMALTIHQMGLRCVNDNLREQGIQPAINKDKVQLIMDNVLNPEELDNTNFRSTVRKLVSLCKATLCSPTDYNGLDMLVDRFNLSITGNEMLLSEDEYNRDRVFTLVGKIMGISRTYLDEIDFDDMIWLPVVMGWKPQQFGLLFVDEAQDLNRSRQELVLSACDTGRLVIIGDPQQAIYEFTGADTGSMNRLFTRLSEDERGCISMPLSYTRRCGKAHVRVAQCIVPGIKSFPDAHEGKVDNVSEEDMLSNLKKKDMVICRVNAPLVQLGFQLVKRKVPVVVRGRDIGQNLITFISRMKSRSLKKLRDKIHTFLAKERIILERDKQFNKLHQLEDQCYAVLGLCDEPEITSVRELKDFIERLFSDEQSENMVLLSSIHKAKGLEANTVYIIEPGKLPHPMGMKTKEDVQQEYNICYVAVTRAKQNLYFVGDTPNICNPDPI